MREWIKWAGIEITQGLEKSHDLGWTGTCHINRKFTYLRMNYRFDKNTLFYCMS